MAHPHSGSSLHAALPARSAYSPCTVSLLSLHDQVNLLLQGCPREKGPRPRLSAPPSISALRKLSSGQSVPSPGAPPADAYMHAIERRASRDGRRLSSVSRAFGCSGKNLLSGGAGSSKNLLSDSSCDDNSFGFSQEGSTAAPPALSPQTSLGAPGQSAGPQSCKLKNRLWKAAGPSNTDSEGGGAEPSVGSCSDSVFSSRLSCKQLPLSQAPPTLANSNQGVSTVVECCDSGCLTFLESARMSCVRPNLQSLPPYRTSVRTPTEAPAIVSDHI